MEWPDTYSGVIVSILTSYFAIIAKIRYGFL